MLPCVCSVIDHRWRQNVVRTKKWHTRRSRVCHWCSYHILTSSVIYYWIRRTATWNLFVLYKKEKPFLLKNILHNAKAGLLPRLCPAFARKKPFYVIYLFKMKQFHWLLCVAKNCDWPRKTRHCQTWLERRPLLNWIKTYSESRIELQNLQILKKMLEKSSQFLSSE